MTTQKLISVFFLLISWNCFSQTNQQACTTNASRSREADIYLTRAQAQSDEGKFVYTDICSVPLKMIHPTQFSVGYLEVQEKEQKISNMSGKKYQIYLSENPLPVIIGPAGQFFIIDHHHLGRAFMNLKIEQTTAIILENRLAMGEGDFWTWMTEKKYWYPVDESGKIRSWGELKSVVPGLNQLKDDPYRSLAGATRCSGDISRCTSGQWLKQNIPFIEFRWAEFFRANPGVQNAMRDYDGSDFLALSPQVLPRWKACRSNCLRNT